MKRVSSANRFLRSRLLVRLVVLAVVATVGALFLVGSKPGPLLAPTFEMVPVTLDDSTTFFVQTHEVTVTEWNQCHAAGGCTLRKILPNDANGREFPATGLSYLDVTEFLDWVNSNGRSQYRLPTAKEWSALAVGVLPAKPDPIFTDPELTWASAYIIDAQITDRRLRPSGAFATTTAGISDLNGNVWEWTQDCYSGTTDAQTKGRCPAFVVGGEHIAVIPYLVRDPARGGCAVGAPPAHLGMRLVTDDRYLGILVHEPKNEG